VHASTVLAVSLSPTGDWTQAAAIMTFAIPVGLFVIVAAVLYFQYTRPHVTPGHRALAPAAAGAGAGAGTAAVAPAAPPAAPTSAGPAQAAEEAPAAEDATEDTE
jgi:hypothetical protein